MPSASHLRQPWQLHNLELLVNALKILQIIENTELLVAASLCHSYEIMDGIMDGIMEYWNNGILGKKEATTIPIPHVLLV